MLCGAALDAAESAVGGLLACTDVTDAGSSDLCWVTYETDPFRHVFLSLHLLHSVLQAPWLRRQPLRSSSSRRSTVSDVFVTRCHALQAQGRLLLEQRLRQGRGPGMHPWIQKLLTALCETSV